MTTKELDLLRACREAWHETAWPTRIALGFFWWSAYLAIYDFPWVPFWEGSRINLFLGSCLVAGWLPTWWGRTGPLGHRIEGAVTAALFILGGLSAGLGSEPSTSVPRTALLLVSGISGFWVARWLLHTRARLVGLGWFLGVAAILYPAFKLGRIWDLGGMYMDPAHRHPMIGMLTILSVVPLTLLDITRPWLRWWSVGHLLALGALTVSLRTKIALLIPLAMGLARIGIRRTGTGILVLIGGLVLIGAGFLVAIEDRDYWSQGYRSIQYRLESVPFSLTVARANPWLGNGLLADREGYLAGYRMLLPDYPREVFRAYLKTLRTSENQYLTLLADLGPPFTILYFGSVLVLLFRGCRAVRAGARIGPYPGWPVILVLAGSLAHMLVFDTLLHPQLAFYFHLFLGLLPVEAGPGSSR